MRWEESWYISYGIAYHSVDSIHGHLCFGCVREVPQLRGIGVDWFHGWHAHATASNADHPGSHRYRIQTLKLKKKKIMKRCQSQVLKKKFPVPHGRNLGLKYYLIKNSQQEVLSEVSCFLRVRFCLSSCGFVTRFFFSRSFCPFCPFCPFLHIWLYAWSHTWFNE